jgi:hypothetical protein
MIINPFDFKQVKVSAYWRAIPTISIGLLKLTNLGPAKKSHLIFDFGFHVYCKVKALPVRLLQ